MPVIDQKAAPLYTGSSYPEPHASEMGERSARLLGQAGGLTQFGVNLMTMRPGSKSSLRHWHEAEDEFLWMLTGELVLVENDGETVMRPGAAVAWPRGEANGHHLINRSDAEATFLVVGTRAERDVCHYSDVDLLAHTDGEREWFTRRDGAAIE
jgi:uncharacterized cupin superfamily protein